MELRFKVKTEPFPTMAHLSFYLTIIFCTPYWCISFANDFNGTQNYPSYLKALSLRQRCRFFSIHFYQIVIGFNKSMKSTATR